jgi:poly-gamma-glutamate synthesis protein (capsule biosynthesis protein)
MGYNKEMRWIFVFFILGVILFIGSSFLIKPRVVEVSSLPTQVSKPEIIENKTITVILVGDIMLDRGVEYMVEKEGSGDFKFPFLKIADELKNADILFGNLEGPISDKGTKVGSIYSFRNDPKAIEGLTYAGFDVVSLANNHAFDYGREALEDCLTRFSNEKIDYVGAGFSEDEAFSPIVKEIKDTKIAFLAYTNLGPEIWKAGKENSGIAWISENDMEKIKKDIENAKEKSDILIVSLHAGEEYQKEPTQFQIDFAKMAIDAGADLVVGHHPHVVQKNERYPEGKQVPYGTSWSGYIFYSLGNFVFDQSFSDQTMQGQMVKVLIENNKIKKVVPINIKINQNFQPEIP